jgi:hypothetical protein
MAPVVNLGLSCSSEHNLRNIGMTGASNVGNFRLSWSINDGYWINKVLAVRIGDGAVWIGA